MNKEEMEKKRDLLALEKREPYNLEYRNIVGALFCAGWDACAEEYEKALLIAKADIMNLTEEIERLKSWEHFKKTLSVMQTFQSLGELEKEAINLMIDGIKFRKQKGE